MAEGAPSAPATGWLEAAVCLGLKCKPEKFKKLLASEEGGRPLLDFLSDPDSRRVFVLDGSKELQCTAALTGKEKKKVVYFLKLRSVALTAENIGDEAVSGDLLPGSWDGAALEHMYRACQEVFLPLLANPNNQQGWPEVIVREVIDSFHKLVAGVYVTIGQIQGKTLLPLPPVELSSVDRASKDKERVHVLETAVVTWTRQIKNVLKLDPEQVLKSGTHPGPLEEIEFWEKKATNLNSIQEQLQAEKIRKVVRVLDLTKSTYFPAFNRLCKEVSQACVEANDNVKFLAALKVSARAPSRTPAAPAPPRARARAASRAPPPLRDARISRASPLLLRSNPSTASPIRCASSTRCPRPSSPRCTCC